MPASSFQDSNETTQRGMNVSLTLQNDCKLFLFEFSQDRPKVLSYSTPNLMSQRSFGYTTEVALCGNWHQELMETAYGLGSCSRSSSFAKDGLQ